MIYRVTLSIAANTPKTSLSSSSLSLPPGSLIQEFLTFPDGCAGLVGCRIVVRERVIWPSNPDEWFINNNFTYVFTDPWELPVDEETFRLEGYNLDQVYSHSVFLALVEKPLSSNAILDMLASLPALASLGD